MVKYEELDRGMKQYFKNLKKYDPLPRDEEKRLLTEYKLHNDVKARNKVIEANLRYTCKLAKDYCNNGLSFSELLSEANDGLLDAIERYDINKDVKLITYSRYWTRLRIERAINGKKRYLGINDMLNDDDADFTDDDREALVDYRNGYEEMTVEEDEISEYEKLINDPEKIKEFAEDMLSVLNEREKNIYILNYGFNGNKPQSMEEISKRYGITRERVRQIIRAGMMKMRSEAMLSRVAVKEN